MSFDLLAPHYRWMEFVLAGEKLQRCRTAFLGDVRPPRDILILGEGNGRFLNPCAHRFPHANITCVDASRRMLDRARKRAGEFASAPGRIEFVQANVLEWQPNERRFDLVVSNFFLDCFRPEQLDQIVSAISNLTDSGAQWLVADFHEFPRGWRRQRCRLILASMYLFFRYATGLPARRLTPPDVYLARNGFSLQREVLSEWGLLRSQLWEKG